MFQPGLQDQLRGKDVLHRAETGRAFRPALVKQAFRFDGGQGLVDGVDRQMVAALKLTAKPQDVRRDRVVTAVVLVRQADDEALRLPGLHQAGDRVPDDLLALRGDSLQASGGASQALPDGDADMLVAIVEA